MLKRLNLQFFSADTGSEGGGDSWIDSMGNPTDTTGQTQETATNTDENFIPKKRFDDVNTRYKTLNDDYKSQKEEYDATLKQLEEAGDTYKQLEESQKVSSERIESLEGVLKTMLDAELELIDEEYRELVPEDKPIEQQLEWLAKAKAKGLFGSKGFEFEIGGTTNPRSGKGTSTQNMNPIQLLTMGYSK